MTIVQPTEAICPANRFGVTHHLIPRRQGQASELACVYCRLSEAAIRALLAQPEGVNTVAPHVQTLTISPDLEVIGSCADCSWHKFGDSLVAYEEIRVAAREHAVLAGHAATITKTNRTTTTYRVLTGDEP